MTLTSSLDVCVHLVCALLIMAHGSANARPIPESKSRVCQPDDLLLVQNFCHKENTAFLEAKRVSEDDMMCKPLFDLWYCVAGNVPQCFQYMTVIHRSYFHSPHNCHLSQQQIMTLQNLTAETAHRQDPGHEVDVEVDVIVPLSVTTTPSPANGVGHPPGVGDGGQGTSDEQHGQHQHGDGKTGTHKHTGSGPSIWGHCSLPLLVLSWLSALKMTSYLLLS